MSADWHDQEGLGARWNIPPRTLSQWRYLGRGPRYYKFGGHVRYRDDDVVEWERAQAVDPDAVAS